MRIAIDLTSTPKNKTGIGRYMLGLIQGLQTIDETNQYFLFVQDDDMDGFHISKPNFHLISVKSKYLRKTWLRIVWEQVRLPFYLRRYKFDILHCPNFTMPYVGKLFSPRLKIIVSFHDMTYFFLPHYHVGWKREMFKAYIKLSSRQANQVITISTNSEKDIQKYCALKNPNIIVTPMGVDKRFLQTAVLHREEKTQFEAWVKGTSLNMTKNYIFYVGTLEPRKNIPNLMKAYQHLPLPVREKYDLVIAGKHGWLYDEINDLLQKDELLQKSVIFPGFVPDCFLPFLMQQASIIAYVSFYEGFGIPVIEGMASGVVTITSFGSSLQEVAGDGALLVDPNDFKSITEALVWALNPLHALEKEQLLARGKKRAELFTWENCAMQTLKAYQQACEQV